MKKQSIISKPGFRTVRMNLSGWINRKLAGLMTIRRFLQDWKRRKEYAILDLEDRFLRKTSGKIYIGKAMTRYTGNAPDRSRKRYAEEGSRITGRHNRTWKQGEEPYRGKGGREPEQFRKRRNSPGACILLVA